MSALKDNSIEGKIKFLVTELEMVNDVLTAEIYSLLDELEENGYESEQFTKIKNIKSNAERIIEQIKELESERNEQ